MRGNFLLIVLSILCIPFVYAEDIYIEGHFLEDGTYVEPHIQSIPDGIYWDDYGPSQSSFQLLTPQARDYDGDGIPNYLDDDDDNDGYADDYDENPYCRDDGR